MNYRGFNIIFIIILVIIVAGGASYFFVNEYAKEPLPIPSPIPEPTPVPTPISKQIKMSGEITCLPKKGGGAQTMECAIGLSGDDRLYYGLENLFGHDPTYSLYQTGLRVKVTGTLNKDVLRNPDGSYYDVTGVIHITSIQKEVDEPSLPPSQPKPEEEIILREGERDSSFLLKKIYSDRVEGLNFWEYPIAVDEGHPVTLRVGEIVSNGCTVILTLNRIEGNTAVFLKTTDYNRPCPICLSGSTMIDTPNGPIKVKDMRIGIPIWTKDLFGKRVAGIVEKTSKVMVPQSHVMVHLILDDGRELFASPGHPTVDGQTLGELISKDYYDGSYIVSTSRVPYDDTATYDILPSGTTGLYWANNILLKSTLY